MGLMDLASQLLEGAGQGSNGQGQLLSAAVNLLQNHPGGLQGLLDQFQKNGLGEQVASWVGTGENLPLTADHVQQVLGGEQLRTLAQQAGLSEANASSGLAALLPEAINHLTPDGQLPQGEAAQQGIMGLLGKFLG